MSSLEIEEVVLRVARALESSGVAYFLGGSMASSLQGEPRSTNDLDFVVDLHEEQVDQLATILGADFEVDPPSLREAARLKSSWHIYFLPSVLKIDLFIRRSSPFDDSEFSRCRLMEIKEGQQIQVKSPEDTILRKLLWFRAGGEVSTTQWRDVVEVLRVSAAGLDPSYLDHWAHSLGVTDLLARARAAAAR